MAETDGGSKGGGAGEMFDLTIIGGGPTGLFGAFYAGLRGMRTKIVDSLGELGGQLAALYPEKLIFDVAGFREVLAGELATRLVEQAMQYGPTVCLGEVVRGLEALKDGAGYRMETDKGEHFSRTVLIAAGAGAFTPRKLVLPEAAGLEGRSVFYAVKEKAVFAGKNVLIVGGGNSAIDWGLNLLDVAGRITVIHRRNQFRAHEASLRALQRSRAEILPFYELEGLVAADESLTEAVIRETRTGEVRTIGVDAVLVQIGFHSSLGAMKHWPLEVERGAGGAAIRVDARMETSLPGVFAAGDVAGYEGKLKLIATGFGEAATAVNVAKTRVDGSARVYPGHSSELRPQPESFVTL